MFTLYSPHYTIFTTPLSRDIRHNLRHFTDITNPLPWPHGIVKWCTVMILPSCPWIPLVVRQDH